METTQGNLPAVPEQKEQTAAGAKPDMAQAMIARLQDQAALVLPKHITADRFGRVALSCLRKSPEIQAAIQTDQGRFSLLNCLMRCAEMGIEPDGRRAHLIPYKNEVTLIVDYKGIAELVMRSGLVSSLHADKVCDADEFTVDRGEVKAHKVDYRKPRGKAYAFYCLVRFKDGSEKAEIMTAEEVEAIRSRSRAGRSGPWVTDFDEMAKKTVFRRASKWLPLSPEIRTAIEQDDDVIDVTPAEKRPMFAGKAGAA